MSIYFKLILYFVLSLFTFQNIQSQDNYSLYYGVGTGPNIGGEHGVGFEYYFSGFVSSNIAFGLISLPKDVSDISFYQKLSADLGVKLYPLKWVFVGVNYGFIDYVYEEYFDSENNYHYKNFDKYIGFSFSVGIKIALTNKIYISGYYGKTAYKERNCISPKFSDFKKCYPKIGALIGYNL